MEAVASVINSSNFLYAAVTICVLVILLAVLGKRGFFAYQGKGLKIGRSDNDARILIMQQVDYVESFLTEKRHELMNELMQYQVDFSPVNLSYTFEKIYDKILYWLLVNNIRTDRTYVQSKASEARRIMYATLSELKSPLINNEQFTGLMDRVTGEYVEELLKGLVQIKQEGEKHAG